MLVLPAMLHLPPHRDLPLGQFFTPNMNLVDFKSTPSAMGLLTIPAWLDHLVVEAWLAHYATSLSAMPAPIPFTSPGAPLVPCLSSAIFLSAIDVLLQDTAALIFANNMHHACVQVMCPKSPWGCLFA